eukprot:m.139075 g.139075  ORF g.139075 m.139075 type:complete len:307 (+) comp17611_c0_seq1:263-1183(+)
MAEDLLGMFMSMGTTDHAELVEQFLQVIPGAPRDAAQFFLEANNFNLQAAILTYMDEGGTLAVSQSLSVPMAEFVCDVTIGEGEEIPPEAVFTKTWRLRNIGQEPWPQSTVLYFCQGDRMQGPDYVRVPALPPGAEADVAVDLRAPPTVGSYAGSWRLLHHEGGGGAYFGNEIWVIITVSHSGMLDTLQQLDANSLGNQQSGGTAVQLSNFPLATQPTTISGNPQQQSPFAAPMFGSLSAHTFGATMAPQQQQVSEACLCLIVVTGVFVTPRTSVCRRCFLAAGGAVALIDVVPWVVFGVAGRWAG